MTLQLATDTSPEATSRYGVVVHHDSRHTFRYCKSLLMNVFGLDDDEACRHCWTITTQGKSTVWIGKYHDAERFCQMIAEFQTVLDAQNARRANVDVDAGHPPLRTTIECILCDA